MQHRHNLIKAHGREIDNVYQARCNNAVNMRGSVVPWSRFLGDTGVPLPEFQGDTYKFWGTQQTFNFLPVKLNSHPEISVHFLFKFELDVNSFVREVV